MSPDPLSNPNLCACTHREDEHYDYSEPEWEGTVAIFCPRCACERIVR